MSLNKMTLKVRTPERLVLNAGVDKVIAEAGNGFFCLLPRHIDYLAVLVPGVLSYFEGSDEKFLAVDRGILVKCGTEVSVSVRGAIQGEDLDQLEEQVRERFRKKDLKDEEISMAMSQLEADFIRRFVEMNEQWRHGMP